YLERHVIQSASAICLTTEEAAISVADRYPQIPRTRFCVLHTGYDPLDFPPRYESARRSDAPIRFVYAGCLYGKRDPIPFLRALAQALTQFKTNVSVELIGDVEPTRAASLRRTIGELDLENVV